MRVDKRDFSKCRCLKFLLQCQIGWCCVNNSFSCRRWMQLNLSREDEGSQAGPSTLTDAPPPPGNCNDVQPAGNGRRALTERKIDDALQASTALRKGTGNDSCS